MKKNYISGLLWILIIMNLSVTGCKMNRPSKAADRYRMFNAEWRFVRDSLVGAEQPAFEDSDWMVVDLPHDYSIMDLPGDDGPDQIGPFSKSSPGGGRSNGNVLGGTGWYRKHFTIDKSDAGKTVVLSFDGVYMETEVWVNGKQAGVHKYGYTPFWFDVTDLLNPEGETNVIAVKVDNTGRNTRWYSGSGIYRDVHLIVTDPLHVAVWGVQVTTPQISTASANVDLNVTVQNDGETTADAEVNVKILNSNKRNVGEDEKTLKLSPHASNISKFQITVSKPDLWSLETPEIYEAEVTVKVDDKITDTYTQSFGIRTLEFSAEKGFLLNGKAIELKGACMHHDNGLLGSAAIDRAEERKVQFMKANGYNAIRCAHNPPSETFLNACDRIGMLVIDEFVDMWETPKNPEDYSVFFKEWWKKDLESMILRDRNHPGIILWSIGNEIREWTNPEGLEISRGLIGVIRENDPSRFITEAINAFGLQDWGNAPALDLLDVAGYNYAYARYEPDHINHPDRIMMGTESFPEQAFDNWILVEEYPYVIGDFVWTGLDYLGEVALGRSQYVDPSQQPQRRRAQPFAGGPPAGGPPTGGPPAGGPPSASGFPGAMPNQSFRRPSNWPWFGAWCGDIDITGEKKPPMIYRDVLWDNSKLEINVHAPAPEGMVERVGRWGWPDEWPSWNWKSNEGKPLQVRVFTKGDRVKLELNGKVTGEQTLTIENKYAAVFDVPYEPGELKATAYENGKEIAVKVLKTTGDVVGIRLIADRSSIKADRNDLAFVTIEAIDNSGLVVPDADVKVKLTVSGNGELAASGNGSPDDMESFNRPLINTFKGRAQAIIRPYATPGTITLKAESEGLKEEVLKISAK
jgi:beta-galactosidase